MPSTADLLTMLCKKTGMDVTAIQKMIDENDSLKTIPAPDTIYNTWEKNLLTVEQAKHNVEVKNHYVRQALDAVDAKINEVTTEYEFDDTLKDPISKASSSYEKIKLMAEAVRQMEGKKAAAVGSDKKALQDEITKLNSQIVTERKKWDADMKAAAAQHMNEKKDLKLDARFNGFNYSKQWDRDIAITAGRAYVEKRLAEQGGKIKYDSETGGFSLVNSKDESLPFTINNEIQHFDSFINKCMADSKLLQVNDPKATTGDPVSTTQPGGPNLTPVQRGALADIDKMLNDQRTNGLSGLPNGQQQPEDLSLLGGGR